MDESKKQPSPGVTVEYTVKGVVTDLDDHETVVMVRADGEERAHYVPRSARIEVVEPVDDPSKDPVGARRNMSTPEDSVAGVNHAEIGNWAVRWTTDKHSDTPWVYFRWDGPQLLSNETVAGRPRMAPLSGTPAAEATVAAEQIAEWRETDEQGPRQPRVFRSDGPEPPPDVTVLEEVGSIDFRKYLLRTNRGWAWSARPVLYNPSQTDSVLWPRIARFIDPEPLQLREVLS